MQIQLLQQLKMIQSTCPRRNKLVLGKFKFGEFLRITNFEEMKWIGVNLEIKGRMRGKNIGSDPNVDRFSTRKTLYWRRRKTTVDILIKTNIAFIRSCQSKNIGSDPNVHLNKENFVSEKNYNGHSHQNKYWIQMLGSHE